MSKSGMSTYAELADLLDELPVICREKRRRESLSLRAAAEQAGVSFSVLTRFENGTGVHGSSISAILRWLG